MIQVAGISFAILLCSIVLKNYNRNISVLLSVAGTIILIFVVADKIDIVISNINELSSGISGSLDYIKMMLKVLGIILIAQIMSDICRDNGESAIASTVEICAKIIVISLILPLFETILSLVIGLLK